MKMMLNICQWFTQVCDSIIPVQHYRIPWRELNNKLQAFDLFAYVDIALQFPVESLCTLPDLVGRAGRLEPHFKAWAIEGLGRYYAEKCWEDQPMPRDILRQAMADDLPPKSLIPLHTGMGLAFADRLLSTVTPQSHPDQIHHMLWQFDALCRANAKPGYVGAVKEALGLVARHLYPQMVLIVDQHLAHTDPTAADYFWHGVGRGLYFLPAHSLPCARAAGRVMTVLQREAQGHSRQHNALAGLAWAITLVNLRHPEVLAGFVRQHSETVSRSDAFTNGVVSSLLIWRVVAPNDPYLSAFCQYEPDPYDPGLSKLWRCQVQQPCQKIGKPDTNLSEHPHLIEEMFRYHPLIS